MTVKTSATLQDRFAESILQTLQEIAPKMMEEEFDYDSMLILCGVVPWL